MSHITLASPLLGRLLAHMTSSTQPEVHNELQSRQRRRDRGTATGNSRGKSGPALGGTEYRLMPSACRLIVRAKL